MRCRVVLLLSVPIMTLSTTARAEEPIPYGAPINLETALKVVAAAEVEAKKQNWPVAITVVDYAGFLVAFHRLDNTQLGSVEVSLEKAKTSALFRRATRTYEDTLAQGGANLKVLRVPALPIEGGLPIIRDGKIIGAIGVSGVKSTEDAQVARGPWPRWKGRRPQIPEGREGGAAPQVKNHRSDGATTASPPTIQRTVRTVRSARRVHAQAGETPWTGTDAKESFDIP